MTPVAPEPLPRSSRFVRALGPLAVLCAVASTGAQQVQTSMPPPGTSQAVAEAPVRGDAAISGVVLDAGTKQPIPDAVVQLGPIGTVARVDVTHRQFTDSRGRFAFIDLPTGIDYSVTVEKAGYFVARRSAIHLTAGQWFADANVTMTRPGSLSGTVLDERGEPVVGVYVRALARVRVAGVDRLAAVKLTLTDDRGMYRVADLYPGRYVVMVPSVQASAPAGASAGVLLGRPEPAAQAAPVSGRGAVFTEPAIDLDATTRLIVRGYPVPPPPLDGARLTYPITFAGGTSLAQATTHVVEASTDVVGVDVRLAPVPAVRISGVVEGPADARAGITLRLLPEGIDDVGLGGEAGTALVAADGSFVFANVPAGNYVIQAPVSINHYLMGEPGLFYAPRIPSPPGMTGTGTISGSVALAPGGVGFSATNLSRQSRLWGRTSITAGPAGASNVVLSLQPTVTMRGRFVEEADPKRPPPTDAPRFVNLETATGSTAHGTARSGLARNVPPGEFAIESIVPGLYILRSDSAWLIKSAIVNGRDYAHVPIDIAPGANLSDVVITFTNAIPSIDGIARVGDGSVATEAWVILFPAEPEQWVNYGLNPARIKVARTSSTGVFRVRAMPAGDYYVVALPSADAEVWREEGFFKRAQPSATRVTVGWGEQKMVDVRLSDVR